MRIGSQICILTSEFDFADLKLGIGADERGDIKVIPFNRYQVIVIEVNNVTSVAHNRAHIADHKVLAFPDSQDQRTSPSSCQYHVW